MKRHFFFLIFLFTAISSFSQTGVKVYGYEREAMPGIVQNDSEEKVEGSNVERTKTEKTFEKSISYLVYISSSSKSAITPVEMWIRGERFNVMTEPVTKTPIILPNKTGKSTTLVAKTSNKVQQVVAVPFTKGKEFSLAKKKAAWNELVVVYKQNGKYYSALLKKIKVLEPQFSE
ncbi:MAG: hypothetical protein ACXWV9_07575 [Flavisolibacter sp.]